MMESLLSNAPSVQLESGWKTALQEEFSKEYFIRLKAFIRQERAAGKVIYPPGNKIFSAFDLCPFDQVKVVIIGQDPYHGEGQANGLCFSVRSGMRKPPSLLNIFKELQADLGIPVPVNGNLEGWAKQGVLLLNATLTVEASLAGSHQHKGWEQFTDEAIRQLSAQKNKLVFLLWGKFAQEKAALIDAGKHHVLTAAHPSPLARVGFAGCRHFSKTNELLAKEGLSTIDWSEGLS